MALRYESKIASMCHLGRSGFDLLMKKGCMSLATAFRLYLKRRNQYKIWMRMNEPDEAGLQRISEEGRNFSYRPMISMIMPTWNTGEAWLKAAIDSVLMQTYDNWELCIADGGSTESWIRAILEKYARKDGRIKVKFLARNLGIAGNTNEAMHLAGGKFIGFLDHDDALAPFAFYEIIKLLNEKPETEFIYSDEDKIDENEVRTGPFFKPDWSPDMFLSCNYPIHISVLKKSLIDDLGELKRAYDGSQDYDLLLRASERIAEDRIEHIAKILYHWRTLSTSTALTCKSKPYAYQTAKRALEDAMVRRGIKIEEVSDGLWQGSYRVKYKLQADSRVAIIIPTRDKSEVLRRCVSSILARTAYQDYEIVIVDNQSQEEDTLRYFEELRRNSKIRILHFDAGFNYSAINNFAVSSCDSDYILLLNNDTEVISSEWLSSMLEHAQRLQVGAVGAKLLFKKNLIQHCGVTLGYGDLRIAGHHYYGYPDHNGYGGVINTIRDVSAVTGACMMTRRSLFCETGGLDEENLTISLNDVDYCLRLREKGYLIVYTPYARLYHHESVSRGSDDSPENNPRFQREAAYLRKKWGKIIDQGDPYYNPNLTLDRFDLSLKI
jgi:O-antigen biosynthesis protein